MSSSGGSRKHRKPRSGKRHEAGHGKHHHPAKPPGDDLGVYVIFLLIWLVVTAGMIIAARDAAWLISVSMIALFSGYLTSCCVRAYRGAALLRWQQGLVRLPLIIAGGKRRPISTFSGSAEARRAILMTVVLTVAAITVAGLMAWRNLHA